MPLTLTPAQIELAHDMEAIAAALASGYALPPRSEPYLARAHQVGTDAIAWEHGRYRDQVGAGAVARQPGLGRYREEVAAWLAEENAKIKANAERSVADEVAAGAKAEEESRAHWLQARAAAAQRAARAEQERAAAMDTGGDKLDPPGTADGNPD